MNVKISPEGTLFKITEDELAALMAGERVETRIPAGGGFMAAEIAPFDADKQAGLHLAMEGAEARLSLHVGLRDLQTLSDLGRSRDGIALQTDPVAVRLQVDLRADTRPRKKT